MLSILSAPATVATRLASKMPYKDWPPVPRHPALQLREAGQTLRRGAALRGALRRFMF